MSFEDFDMEVAVLSEDDLDQPPPDGTIANVQVRVDAESGDYSVEKKDGKYGPFLSLRMEVVGGEYNSLWVTFILNIDPKRKAFRAVQEMMGADLTAGGPPMKVSDIVKFLCDNVFEVELTPNEWTNDSNELIRNTKVKSLIKVAVEGELPAETAVAPDAEAVDTGAELADDDIPF